MSFQFDDISASVYDSFIVEQFGHQAMVEKPRFYNFVCPNCGDMNFPNKKKAYVYKDKWLYKCHKCGTSIPFALHLKQNDPDAYKRLIFTAFGDGHDRAYKKKPDEPVSKVDPTLPFKEGELIPLTANGPAVDAARAICIKRRIREEVYSDWYVCLRGDQFYDRDLYGNVVRDPVTGVPRGNEYHDRIIIPFYRFGGKWSQFDARAIDPGNPLRYRNFTGVKRIAYNIDFINYDEPFYILEGTIDSTFIRNSIAIGGIQHLSEIMTDNPNILAHADNCVMLWDNDEPGVKARWSTCNAGYKWFDWSGIHEKDINGAVMSGEMPLDEDGYVVDEFIRSRVRSAGAANILFAMQYGNMERKEYLKRKQNAKDARAKLMKMREPEVFF